MLSLLLLLLFDAFLFALECLLRCKNNTRTRANEFIYQLLIDLLQYRPLNSSIDHFFFLFFFIIIIVCIIKIYSNMITNHIVNDPSPLEFQILDSKCSYNRKYIASLILFVCASFKSWSNTHTHKHIILI